MAKPKYIRPMKLVKPNQCLCGGELLLVENTISVTTLNDCGMPINNSCEEDVEAELICSSCGREYNVSKEGPFFRVKTDIPCLQKPTNKIKIKEFNPFYMG